MARSQAWQGARRISNEKHASNINIHRSVKSVPHGVIWQIGAISVFPADEVCTGMKFVPVPEKAQKKRAEKPSKILSFIHYHVAIFANIQ